MDERKKTERRPSVYSRANDTDFLAEILENQSLSETERKEFDRLLDWITYDSDEAVILLPEKEQKEIDVTIRQIQEKIYWDHKEPTRDDLAKLRKITVKLEHALKTA